MDELLSGADRELAAENLVGGGPLAFLILDAEDRLGMADGELAFGEEALEVVGQVEEAHRVGHRGARLADTLRDVFLLHLEFAGQADVAGPFLDRVEVLALKVLDEGHLEDLAVGRLALDHRHGRNPELGAGPPAAFPGDEFHLAVDGADDERLDDPVLADRLKKLVEGMEDSGREELGNPASTNMSGSAKSILKSNSTSSKTASSKSKSS